MTSDAMGSRSPALARLRHWTIAVFKDWHAREEVELVRILETLEERSTAAEASRHVWAAPHTGVTICPQCAPLPMSKVR